MLDSDGVTFGGYSLYSCSGLALLYSFLFLKVYSLLIMQESSGVCFLVCLLMMLFDTVLYGAIGLYLDKVYFLDYILLCQALLVKRKA